MVKLNNDWDELLKDEFQKEYYQNLREFLKQEYSSKVIYPNMYNIFEALKHTSFKDTKVLILGQDPYHGENQAHGLAFSVQKGVKIPPSLLNIYKELHEDLDCYIPNNGYLIPWADQGVLLLNTALTVRVHEANSHQNIGWEIFTDNIIKLLNKEHCSFTKSEQKWDYLYANDAGKAFYLVGKKVQGSHIYCLGSGVAKPLKEYIEKIRDIVSPNAELGFGELKYPENPVMNLCANIKQLQCDTGWKPEVEFEVGIKKICKYLQIESEN